MPASRRPTRRRVLFGGLALSAVPLTGPVARSAGLLADPDVFPTGVWLQNPINARAWAGLGVNLYVALWEGPTEAQLSALAAAGMSVIAPQSELSLQPRWRDTVVAWMAEPDEPDNAQPLPGGGWGAPVMPEEMQQRAAAIRARDPSRPVYLNLGQGAAWDGWYGRGTRTHHPEDYPGYAAAADIVSFDVYPIASTLAPVAGKVELIGHGVQRLRDWAGPHRTVWAVIAASRIGNPNRVPSPAEIRAQAWMAVVHGAQGIIWFAHQFAPRFVEAAPLADPVLGRAVATVNAELASLAPVLNRGNPVTGLRTDPGIALRALDHNGALHVFCIRVDGRSGRLRIGLPEGIGPGMDLATGAAVLPRDGVVDLNLGGYEPRILRFSRA